MPKSGPVSKTYYLPPRRPQRRYKATQQNASSSMSSPPYKKQGASGDSDAVGADSMDKISIHRSQKRHKKHEEQESAPNTPTGNPSSRQTSLFGASTVNSDTSTENSLGMQTVAETNIEIEIVSPRLLQQRRDHWNGLHLGRDPYGLASKPYLDAGLPPPWPHCDLCEEKMPWLKRSQRLDIQQHQDMFQEETREESE